ncbi:MAG: isochorismatase family protein [Candidatus Omnitrophica bacterium]|nr:isochorismatase family protein [Candidatus Omnitrophota bacterium]
MLYSVEQSVLVVLDLQGNLARGMHNKDVLFRNICCLIQTAQYLEMPILVTEQVPEKIGRTIPEILGVFTTDPPVIAKESFSCWRSPQFKKVVTDIQRREIIICGIEAHVCVSQTVLDLIQDGFRVGCVADAVSARTADNRRVGLRRIRAAGADILSVEMIATELLKTSTHPKFREILKLIK